MYPEPIQKLIDIFAKFPGIGPKQAGRFVFHILKNGAVKELMDALGEFNAAVIFCNQCFRATEKENGELCFFCKNPKRDSALVAVVEKESDLQNIEKTGAFSGLYHVLGGVVSPLDHHSPTRLHLKELHGRVRGLLEKNDRCEVILATSSTSEGDLTALYIERILEPLKRVSSSFKISRLGRGLSLGTELEYADEVTLKNALNNRK